MKKKKWLRAIVFTVGGAFVGWAYYYFVGCANGTCFITSDPLISMGYMGVLSWLISGVFNKDCDAEGGYKIKRTGWKTMIRKAGKENRG